MTDLYDRILATITEQLAEQGLPDANPGPIADALWEVLGHGSSDEIAGDGSDEDQLHVGAPTAAEPHWPTDGSGDEFDGGYDPTAYLGHGFSDEIDPRVKFDRMAAEASVRVRDEHAARYVDLRVAVELADTRTSAVAERDGVVEVYGLKASDWNRVVAVARGHMSQKTRRSLDRFAALATPDTEARP